MARTHNVYGRYETCTNCNIHAFKVVVIRLRTYTHHYTKAKGNNKQFPTASHPQETHIHVVEMLQ